MRTGDNTHSTSCMGTRNGVWVSTRNRWFCLSNLIRKDANQCSCCGNIRSRQKGIHQAYTRLPVQHRTAQAMTAVGDLRSNCLVACCSKFSLTFTTRNILRVFASLKNSSLVAVILFYFYLHQRRQWQVPQFPRAFWAAELVAASGGGSLDCLMIFTGPRRDIYIDAYSSFSLLPFFFLPFYLWFWSLQLIQRFAFYFIFVSTRYSPLRLQHLVFISTNGQMKSGNKEHAMDMSTFFYISFLYSISIWQCSSLCVNSDGTDCVFLIWLSKSLDEQLAGEMKMEDKIWMKII